MEILFKMNLKEKHFLRALCVKKGSFQQDETAFINQWQQEIDTFLKNDLLKVTNVPSIDIEPLQYRWTSITHVAIKQFATKYWMFGNTPLLASKKQ